MISNRGLECKNAHPFPLHPTPNQCPAKEVYQKLTEEQMICVSGQQ